MGHFSLAAAEGGQGEDPEALIRQGNELRRKGDDARAEGYFKRAYELAHTARTAAQLGLVELALGQHARAEALLTEALDGDDAWVRSHNTQIEEGRARARQQLFAVELAGVPSDTTVTIGQGKPAKLRPDNVLWLPPGSSDLRLEAPGNQPATAKVTGVAGERRKLPIELRPLASAAPATPAASPAADAPAGSPAAGAEASVRVEASPAPTPGRAMRLAGIGVGGLGVVAAVVGLVFVNQAHAKLDRIEDASRAGRAYDTADGNWESKQTTGVALMVGGGVAVAGGAALFLLGHRAGKAPTETAVSLDTGPGFGLLRLRGSF